MDLTDDQKKLVEQWVENGYRLAEIQKKINDDLGISATYMDVRFLLIDLGLELKEQVSSISESDVGATLEPPDNSTAFPGSDNSAPLSGVSVTVDRLTKPGSVVSGEVVFSDGVKGSWSLDQLGRLAIAAEQEGYNPGQEDIAAFQDELKKELQKRGF